MPRVCTVCTHPDRAGIDQALVTGSPFRDIAGQFGIGKNAVARHKADHLPAALAKAAEAQHVADADDLLRQAGALRTKALSLLLKAEQAGDYRTALAGIREARGCIELLARLLGELQDGATVNILIMPAWLELRAAVMDALMPYPAARQAVAARMLAIEEGDDADVA